MAPGGELDHRLRNIDPGRVRAPRDRSRSGVSWTRSDIENAHAGSDARRVEQRLDRLSRDRAQELPVASGDELPAGRLKLVECLDVDVSHVRKRAGWIARCSGNRGASSMSRSVA